MKRNQSGFSLIHGLLVLLVVGVVGGVGYVVYAANDRGSKQPATETLHVTVPSNWQVLKSDLDYTVKAPADWSLDTSGVSSTQGGIVVQGKDDDQSDDSNVITVSTLKIKNASKAGFEKYLADLQANTLKTYQSLGYGNNASNTQVVRKKLSINGTDWQQTDLITPSLYSRTLYLWHGNHADTIIVDAENQAKAAQMSTDYLYPMAASVSQNHK